MPRRGSSTAAGSGSNWPRRATSSRRRRSRLPSHVRHPRAGAAGRGDALALHAGGLSGLRDAAAAAALGNFDKVFVEAIRFDDGFSKIVHARQPLSADVLDEDGTGAPMARDEGIQLGWDDEDILEGQNRALGAPPDGEDPVLAPRGVFGYRVDVRAQGTAAWTSLSQVNAPLTLGVDLGVALEERWSEVAPPSTPASSGCRPGS